MRNKIVGITFSQWIFILIAIVIVLLINVMEMIQRLPFYTDIYQYRGSVLVSCGIPWQTIIGKGVYTFVQLGAISWFLIVVTMGGLIQKLPWILKYAVELFLAVIGGVFYTYLSIFYANNWLHESFCGRMYGLLIPKFVIFWSLRLVLPSSCVLNFWAMGISNRINKSALSSTVVPAGPG